MWTRTGIASSSENAVECYPGARGDGVGKRLVIAAHVVSGSGVGWLDPVNGGQQFAKALANAGYAVLCPDLGGASTWGNDASKNAVAAAWTWAKANMAVKTDKFIGLGPSMGWATHCVYAAANPTQVIALAGIIPVCDADDIHDNNRGGYAASIEAAYTNLAGWDAAEPTHNPKNLAASLTGIPMKLWRSSDDPVCTPSTTATFATAAGATLATHGADGHGWASLDPAEIVAFLAPYA